MFKEHKEVRDVLISAGDPLMIDEEMLEYIIAGFRKIEHVEIIRLGSRTPTVCPQRITRSYAQCLKNITPSG
jgi:lysine 2,3-aminomutase